jgi:hypothetical protein
MEHCTNEGEPWGHQDMLFLQSAEILIGTQEATPRVLDADDRDVVRSVSGCLFAAFARHQTAEGKMPIHHLPEHADEYWQLLRATIDSYQSGAVIALWQHTERAIATLNALLAGQPILPQAALEAAKICEQIGKYILATRQPSGCMS